MAGGRFSRRRPPRRTGNRTTQHPKPSVDQNLTDPALIGAIDLHAHYGPDSYDRQWDAFEVVKLAKERGMRGVVLKNHWSESAGLAQLIRKYGTQGIEVFGSVTLDTPVGGVNPMAVRYMADVEGNWGRIVWMPTHDSEHEVNYYKETRAKAVVSRNGKLIPEVFEVLDLIKERNLTLATGHVEPRRGADDHGGSKAARHHPDHRDPSAARTAVHEHVASATAGGREARRRRRDHRGHAQPRRGWQDPRD